MKAAPESFKPVIPLDTSWRMPQASSDLGLGKDLLRNDSATDKAAKTFRESLNKLSKSLKQAEQTKELASLRQAALRLGPKARMIAELTAARVLGGLSSSGAKVSKPSGNWREHLLGACNAAAKIDDETHEKTALQAITIWRRIEPSDSPWSPPPIDIKAQRKFQFNRAIIERQALHEWSKNNDASALKKYHALSVAYSGAPIGAAVDMRIVELERSIYVKGKNLRRWQKILLDTESKYQDKLLLGAGNEEKVERLATGVRRIHRDLIDGLIKIALSKKSGENDHKTALSAIETYLNSAIDNNEKIRVRIASGEIQYLAGQHKDAAGTFAGLASEASGPKAQEFWNKAIRSQTILAKWPTEAPWLGIPKGDISPREVLLDMFRKVDGGTDKDWSIAGHIGLLHIANARTDEAFKLWSDRIQKYPRGTHASRAAGWMVTSYVQGKQWQDVENLGRTLLKANLTALYANKSFRPKDVLGLALIEEGLEFLAAKDYKKSITKLEEFVKGWKGDPRHDQAMYHLALAYYGDRQFRQAVSTLTAFTKTYPKSQWRHDGLVNGGAWTLALTWEDHVMYFLETHALEFPKDTQTINSLQTLADLYMGREIYDSAIRVMTILVNRKDLDETSRTETARRLLDTAARRGSSELALKLADQMQNSFQSDTNLTALALSVKARVYAAKKNTSALASVVQKMNGLDQGSASVAESISEARFLYAEVLAKGKFKDEIFSLGTKDPKAQLEHGYAQFSEFAKNYKSACLAVRTGWCGPSLYRVARIGEEFVKAYDDLDIAKTLDPVDVKSFKDRKQSIIETVENIILESDEKSLEQARVGATNPEWTSAILWQNGGEWTKSKSTDDSGSLYIQWHVH